MPGVMLRNRLDPDVGLMPREIALPVGAVGYTGLAPTVDGVINALYVNASTGSDARSREDAGNPSTPWLTVGRAVWGSTSRSSPNTSECAQPGDTVIIVGSGSLASPTLYTTNEVCANNFDVIYNPAVTGTSGSPITFRAQGYVQLGSPAANGPIVGQTASREYVKWYADRSDSRFILVCDGMGGNTHDTKADTSVVNTAPDTGPITISGAGCWIEGFDIDGGPMIDYVDNWEGIRMQNAVGPTIRNNYIHDFRRDKTPATEPDGVEDTNHNQAAITIYGGNGCIIEHNLLENNGAGVYFKDRSFLDPNIDNIIRYNWIHAPALITAGIAPEGIAWSLADPEILDHGGNQVYQNVVVDCFTAFDIAGMETDWIYNNTIARCAQAIDGVATATASRFWNNICSVTTRVINQGSVTVGDDTEMDFEHNCYFGFGSTTFMSDSSGNHSFAQWLADYASLGQDHEDPDSINDDPEFTNAASDDFTLGVSSPARNLGRHPLTSATMHAGAYQTGSETIGLIT